jgi:hypothetical protein
MLAPSPVVERLGSLLSRELCTWGDAALIAVQAPPAPTEPSELPEFFVAHAPELGQWLATPRESENPAAGWAQARELWLGEQLLQHLRGLNQFYLADAATRTELHALLSELLAQLVAQTQQAPSRTTDAATQLAALLVTTGEGLRQLLVRQRGAALYRAVAGEYAPALQWAALGLEPRTLTGPLLDVGCGSRATLVRSLLSAGIEARGLDLKGPEEVADRGDWLTWDYGRDRWGTVVSHLGFSLHFLHHHLADAEQAARFAHAFLRILRSLKAGGTFAYVPSLPFFEALLPPGLCSREHRRLPPELLERLQQLPLDVEALGLTQATRLTRRA